MTDRRFVQDGSPSWLSPRTALAVGAAFALGFALMAWGFLAYARHATLESAEQQLQMLSSGLQNRATRTLDALDATLQNAAQLSPYTPVEELKLNLSHPSLAGVQQLRSLSMIDVSGRVVASSEARNLGLVLPAEQKNQLEQGQARHLMPLSGPAANRNWAARPATPMGEDEPTFVLVRHSTDIQGKRVLWVAVIETNLHVLFMSKVQLNFPFTMGLLSPEGQSVTAQTYTAGGDGVEQEPQFLGTLSQQARFQEALKAQSKGLYNQPNANSGQTEWVAYQLLDGWPAALAVRVQERDLLARWHRLAQVGWGIVAVVTAMIAFMAGAAYRSLRSRSAMQQKLDSLNHLKAEHERETQLLIDGMRELLFRLDAQGVVTVVNQRWQELTGWSTGAVEGLPLLRLIPTHDHALVQHALEQAPGGTTLLHTHLRCQNGHLLPVEISLSRLNPTSTTLSGYSGFAQDTSELHRARQERQQHEAFSRRVLEVLPLPVFVKDAQGRYVAVNRAWEKLTGIAEKDLVGRSVLDTLFDGTENVHHTTDLKLLRGESDQIQYPIGVLRADGQLRDTMVSKILVRDEKGQPQGLVGSVHDVTEYLETQRAMEKARDAAVASDSVKSNFIANVSHELRTPLQSVLGFSELALRRQLSPEKQRAVLEDIYRAGQRMLKLVNEILDISRLESNVARLEVKPGDLCDVVREVAREVAPIAQQRNVPIRLELPDQGLPSEFNAFRLGQVVRNVLANALRFSPRGAEVVVRVRPDHVGQLITVRDHGPGIPKTELESIFEPFTQSSLTNDGSGGTGLGLTISRSIMRAHQGRIWAENAVGDGSLFCIWLPGTAPPGPSSASVV